MDLPKQAGRIVRMISAVGFMEIYATGGTFQVRTPDDNDPARTNPAMPWSQAKASGAGTANAIVARLVIQTHDALQQLNLRPGSRDKILAHMRVAKEEALNCEAALTALKRAYAAVNRFIRKRRARRSGSSIETPQVDGLSLCATQFITSAKRALQAAGEVYNEFYQPPKGGLMKNGNLGFAMTHLATQVPPNGEYIQFLKQHESTVKRLIDLRNGQEHADDASRTVIENIRLSPDGFAPPMWRRLPEPPSPVVQDMSEALPFLVDFIESHFLFGLLENAESIGFPLRLQPIPQEERDPDCPVAFRMFYERQPPATGTTA